MRDVFPRNERYLNREWSWLDFNGRVLTIRQDDKRAIAAMLDIPVDQVALRLEALDLVFRPG